MSKRSKVHLESFLKNKSNLIEMYLCESYGDPSLRYDIKVSHSKCNAIRSKYRNWKTTKYIAYSRNHQTYLYDLTDDNQHVFTKYTTNTKYDGNHLYILSYEHSKLPTHLFPCVNDIDDISEYTIEECKISNRISLNIKVDKYGAYVYVEYKHSPQVDLDKIEGMIQGILDII